MYFSLLFVRCPGSGSQLSPLLPSLIVTVPWDPKTQAPPPPLATRARCLRGSPWVAAAKILGTHVSKSAPLGDTGAVEHGRGIE